MGGVVKPVMCVVATQGDRLPRGPGGGTVPAQDSQMCVGRDIRLVGWKGEPFLRAPAPERSATPCGRGSRHGTALRGGAAPALVRGWENGED